jgi:amidase
VTEIIFDSAASLAEAIRQKRVSSSELTQAYLERIERVNPSLNAVVMLDDTAMEQARAADSGLAKGEDVGPLHGVPITLKDSHDTVGVVTTGGTLGRADFVPDRDSTVAARLRAAGVVLLGKTNTPELTMGMETDNLVYGRTNNPYDTTRTSGGSSGGGAAIVAAGGSAFDIGSDTGGSIRFPGHCCGVAGIKPTSGRVPRTGHIIPYGMGIRDSPNTDRPHCPLHRGPGARPAHHSGTGLEGPRNRAYAAWRPRLRRPVSAEGGLLYRQRRQDAHI